MPTPARLATSETGAAGSALNTARAASRIRWSLRAASACRPGSGAGFRGMMPIYQIGAFCSAPAPGRAEAWAVHAVIAADSARTSAAGSFHGGAVAHAGRIERIGCHEHVIRRACGPGEPERTARRAGPAADAGLLLVPAVGRGGRSRTAVRLGGRDSRPLRSVRGRAHPGGSGGGPGRAPEDRGPVGDRGRRRYTGQ